MFGHPPPEPANQGLRISRTCERDLGMMTPCAKPTRWRPTLVLREKPGATVIRVQIGIGLCRACGLTAKAQDLLDDVVWAELIAPFDPTHFAPKRRLTQLRLEEAFDG